MDGPCDMGTKRGPRGCRKRIKQWGCHAIKFIGPPSPPDHSATREEGEEPEGLGTQVDRGSGLRVQELVLGRVPSQTYGSFEGAWKITASRKELSIASSKPPALRELRSAGHLSGGSITRREHVGGELCICHMHFCVRFFQVSVRILHSIDIMAKTVLLY